MIWYAIASLTPAALLALACLMGGVWPLLAVLWVTVFVFFMDKLPHILPEQEASGRILTLSLAALHFPLLGLGVWAIGTAPYLSPFDKLLIFTGLGLFFGQIANSNAHELIHTSARLPRRIGALIYISLLHGHHVSAHLRVHHIYVATDADPNSARLGEGFWAYALRVMQGEFTAGWRAETQHRARAAQAQRTWTHPYVAYVLGSVAFIVSAYVIAGWHGVVAYFGLALYAQMQLLLSDYVQHYGLRRGLRENGKAEPVGPEHSWNAPKWYSCAMMLNAPRHSDHHMRPARAFPALEVTPQTMPVLPHSLPVMAVVALIPPLWRRIMDRRVKRWQKPA
ncbi:MAG: alkane 1-monooxygenase [Sulfitobacter sp.]